VPRSVPEAEVKGRQAKASAGAMVLGSPRKMSRSAPRNRGLSSIGSTSMSEAETALDTDRSERANGTDRSYSRESSLAYDSSGYSSATPSSGLDSYVGQPYVGPRSPQLARAQARPVQRASVYTEPRRTATQERAPNQHKGQGLDAAEGRRSAVGQLGHGQRPVIRIAGSPRSQRQDVRAETRQVRDASSWESLPRSYQPDYTDSANHKMETVSRAAMPSPRSPTARSPRRVQVGGRMSIEQHKARVSPRSHSWYESEDTERQKTLRCASTQTTYAVVPTHSSRQHSESASQRQSRDCEHSPSRVNRKTIPDAHIVDASTQSSASASAHGRDFCTPHHRVPPGVVRLSALH